MASTWSCFLIYLLLVSVNVFGEDLHEAVSYMKVESYRCSLIDLNKKDNCEIQMVDDDKKVITDKDLIRVRNQATISVVRFYIDICEYSSRYKFYNDTIIDISSFMWVNDKVGKTIMSYPGDYEILSLGTLKFEEKNIHLTFSKDSCSANCDVTLMIVKMIQNVTNGDLFCFRSINTTSAHLNRSISIINIVYNYVYTAMPGSLHHSCFQISGEGMLCKSKVGPNNFYWNEIITAIGLSVMLYCPLLIGVFLRNSQHRSFIDTFNEKRLALNSPLPIGARYRMLHWGNTRKYLLSLRVFILCIIIIISMLVFMTKLTANYLLCFKTYVQHSIFEILLPTILAACQMLAIFIITFHPASLSVFSDGSDCGLHFDSNRYTCLYRQILNRFKLVTSSKLWRDRPFVGITSNRSLIFRRMFLITNILFAFARLLLCLFPVLYIISAPILHVFKFVWFDVVHSRGKIMPRRYIPLVLALNIIRAILFTIFALFLSLQVMVAAVYFMQILILTTIGIVTDYGKHEEVVLSVTTALMFLLYILGSFKDYALLWRTIIDAGESWQWGHEGEDYNEINGEHNFQRNNLVRMRQYPPSSNPLVIYTDLIPTLPENLLFHVINTCKRRSYKVAKIVLWNSIVALFFAVACTTIISTREYDEFTQISRSMLTLAMGALPKLISIVFTTQEYASRQEAKQRRIWHEVFKYAEINGYNRIQEDHTA